MSASSPRTCWQTAWASIPLVVRNVHAVLGGKLDEADQAMEARLASVTLQDIADETRERMKAQDAEDAHGSRE